MIFCRARVVPGREEIPRRPFQLALTKQAVFPFFCSISPQRAQPTLTASTSIFDDCMYNTPEITLRGALPAALVVAGSRLSNVNHDQASEALSRVVSHYRSILIKPSLCDTERRIVGVHRLARYR